MEFQVKILLLSFVATVIISIILIPLLRKLKAGQTEREDGPESHLKKQGTPTMGGIGMILVIIAIGALMYLEYAKTEIGVAKNLIPLLLISLGCGFIGFIDDFKKVVLKNTKGISPACKMLGLLIIAVGFVFYLIKVQNVETSIFIPFLKINLMVPIWAYIPFCVLVILSVTNAVNLTDGVDGLASSVSAIIITCLTIISIMLGVKEVTIIGSILIGTCLGFLLFNLHPAKVFMGDTGSLFLGGAIAGMAIALKMPILILIIAIIPLIETLSVIIQVACYKKTGKRVFKMAPYHHHLELSGWKEEKIVTVFSLITLILCFAGLISI